jgi:hypothetical protein
MKKLPIDVNGEEVTEGAKVKLLSIPKWLLAVLPEEEVADLKSMIGHTFVVYVIDEWGGAWVEKWFNEGEEVSNSHSLSLEPHEMELVK